MHKAILLGVNVDHIATLRQARGTQYPCPVYGAMLAEEAGADGITVHLREDERHIQASDLPRFMASINTRLNLEMAATDKMVANAIELKPAFVCMVPEKREELTTEGGLDVVRGFNRLKDATHSLMDNGIEVSLFIEPNREHIEAAKEIGATWIELHTGRYADAHDRKTQDGELAVIKDSAKFADDIGLNVNAGHGLHYHNVEAIARIPQIIELNIGHAIVARSVFVGLKEAVREMKALMVNARQNPCQA